MGDESNHPRAGELFDLSKFPKAAAQESRDELPHRENPALVRAAREAEATVVRLEGKNSD
jgi:hypothetical protein